MVMFAAALGAGLRATAGGQQEPTDVPKEVWQGYHRHFAHEYFKSWGHWSADGGYSFAATHAQNEKFNGTHVLHLASIVLDIC